jgi:uncharacterized membrane protein
VTLTAIILLLISAAAHAGWNLLGKRQHPTTAFFLLANTLGCLYMTPVLALYGRALGAFPARTWTLLALTGLCDAIYYAALAGAYRAGELSIAYPLVRSLPVVIVALATRVLGQGSPLSGQALLGIALIVAGSLLLPTKRLAELSLRSYWQLSSLLVLLAALGTTGYSLVDDAALRGLRQAPGMPVGLVEVTILYALLRGLSSSAWLLLFTLAPRQGRAELRSVWHNGLPPIPPIQSGAFGGLPRAALTGLGIYLAYTLVLIAMSQVTNVSYVVAFRQLSVPLGAILGLFVLKEPRHLPKAVGVAVMFLGLLLVGLG